MLKGLSTQPSLQDKLRAVDEFAISFGCKKAGALQAS